MDRVRVSELKELYNPKNCTWEDFLKLKGVQNIQAVLTGSKFALIEKVIQRR
jgi:hypothetical protein